MVNHTTEVSRLERVKINDILDRRTEEIFSLLRQVSIAHHPQPLSSTSTSTTTTNTTTMTNNYIPYTFSSLSESAVRSKSNTGTSADNDSKNVVKPYNSTSLPSTTIAKEINELVLVDNNSDDPINAKSLVNETNDSLDRNNEILIVSAKDTNTNNVNLDDKNHHSRIQLFIYQEQQHIHHCHVCFDVCSSDFQNNNYNYNNRFHR